MDEDRAREPLKRGGENHIRYDSLTAHGPVPLAKFARYGEALLPRSSRPPIVMPTDAQIDARRPPKPVMTPETKERLAAIAKAKPKHHVADLTGDMLAGCSNLDEVYEVGAKHLGATVRELKAKYKHLNNGQQRMIIGNRLRALFKKQGGVK